MMSISDRVVVITGGSSGIGLETAITFAKKGAKVAIAARDVVVGEKSLALLREISDNCIFVRTDVSKNDDVKNLIDKVVKKFGRLDFAINNAGIAGKMNMPTIDYSEEMWDKVIDTNLKGVWLSMKYEVRAMIKNNYGVIINVSSIAGLRAGRISAAYTASKHGIIGLTKQLAIENSHNNIRINAICPGFIATPMLRDDLSMEEMAYTAVPLGRCGHPQEVAQTIMWLCSDNATFINGTVLPVDGGMSAQ